MATVITSDILRAQYDPADISDAELDQIIAREQRILENMLGAVSGSRSETIAGGLQNIYLRRQIASVTSIVEDDVALTTDDYEVWTAEGAIQRLPAGSTWGAKVVVTYTPTDDTDAWQEAIIDLVRLQVERTAFETQNFGDYSATQRNWEGERAKIIHRLKRFISL